MVALMLAAIVRSPDGPMKIGAEDHPTPRVTAVTWTTVLSKPTLAWTPLVVTEAFDTTSTLNVAPGPPAGIGVGLPDGLITTVPVPAARTGTTPIRPLTARVAPRAKAEDASPNRRTRWLRFTGSLPLVIDAWSWSGRRTAGPTRSSPTG